MPAEGAMATRLEAPAEEPLSSIREKIAVRGVVRRYPARSRRAEPVTALDGLDLALAEREVLAVVGPSGCGKSTLLELIAGLQDPDAGSVAAGGQTAARERRRACAYMPQRDLLRPGRVVMELEVGFPRPRHRRELVGDPAFAALEARALEALGC